MQHSIFSVTFSRDNQKAFISDIYGSIKMIKWQVGSNSRDIFDFKDEPKHYGGQQTYAISLSNDEKYLIVGGHRLLTIIEVSKKRVVKNYRTTYGFFAIILIQDENKVIISQEDGNLNILDLDTLEMNKIAEKIIKKATRCHKILVI